MPEIIDFTTYNQADAILQTPTDYGTYGNLAEALDANTGWRVIEGGKTAVEAAAEPGVTPSNVYPIAQQLTEAPELEGGIVGASEVVEVTAAAGGGVQAASSGVLAGWTLGTAVAGVLAGVGVGITAFELAPEFWTGLSNRIFGTDIQYEEIKDYTILGRLTREQIDGQYQVTTQLPQNIVDTILRYCNEYGMFDDSFEVNFHTEWVPNTTVQQITFGSDFEKAIHAAYAAYYKINSPTAGQYPAVAYFLAGALNWMLSLQVPSGSNYIYIEFGSLWYGNDLYTAEVSVYFATGSQNTPTNIGNKLSYEIADGTIFEGYELGNTAYVSAIKDTFSVNLRGEITTSQDSITLGYSLSGFKIQSFDWTPWKGVKYSNINCEYEVIPQPYIYPLPDAQVYNPAQTLPQQYPDWTNRAQQTNGFKLPYDDPTLYPIPWLPVAMPEYDPMTNPEKYPNPQTDPDYEPAKQPKAQEAKMPQTLPDPYQNPKNIPEGGKDPKTGNPDPAPQDQPTNPTPTPVITFPTIGGEANAIFTVYNPTLAQLNSLAGVLWTSNFLENLIKVFTNNPMDAIISLHMLYATPTTGSNKNIVLGCYDTGIPALEVTKQYQAIDCGTVRIPEYFGDARDYVNSVVDVYLPFVGMRHLKTQDIIGSYVTIKACVDVFTGTILYTINIRKTSGIDQVMYAFEGNCGVQLPLTGADKSRMFSVLGAAASGAMIGGVAGAVGGAALATMNGSAQADIQRSGNFGSNAGAMGVKKPYIVVSRNIGYDSNNYNRYHGFPTNITVSLASCAGYTRVLDCHLTGIEGATDTELEEIESLLKEGVII